MQSVSLNPDFFEGAISVEQGDGWLKPWRLPHEQRQFFPSPDDALFVRAEMASGVRLRFATDATSIQLCLAPMVDVPPACERDVFHFDATIDGELVASAPVPPRGETAAFDGLPESEKTIELWFPPESPVAVRELRINDGASCTVPSDPRPRWITYGSSLTHCVRSHSPARSWPAIVARRHGLNLTCLGFGGQCHLDAMIGRLIRDMPADLITLKLGINTISGSLNARTYPIAATALVALIREKHAETPIGLVSPIGYPPHETTPNAVGYTIGRQRRDLEKVYHAFADAGDEHIHYTNGLEVFNLDLIAQYTQDQCHPNGDGIEIMAENFDHAVMEVILKAEPGLA